MSIRRRYDNNWLSYIIFFYLTPQVSMARSPLCKYDAKIISRHVGMDLRLLWAGNNFDIFVCEWKKRVASRKMIQTNIWQKQRQKWFLHRFSHFGENLFRFFFATNWIIMLLFLNNKQTSCTRLYYNMY